jgi:hypothetical protein
MTDVDQFNDTRSVTMSYGGAPVASVDCVNEAASTDNTHLNTLIIHCSIGHCPAQLELLMVHICSNGLSLLRST